MVLLEVESSDGRMVQLTELHLIGTLEWRSDDPETSARNWQALLIRFFGKDDLPVYIQPGAESSWVTCIGTFASRALHSDEHAKDYSYLVICWFTGSELSTIGELVTKGLRGVNWNAHARDYDAWAV